MRNEEDLKEPTGHDPAFPMAASIWAMKRRVSRRAVISLR